MTNLTASDTAFPLTAAVSTTLFKFSTSQNEKKEHILFGLFNNAVNTIMLMILMASDITV